MNTRFARQGGASSKWREAAHIALVLTMMLPLAVRAQSTSGDAANGAILFSANCSAGCHGATPLAVFPATANAANAGGHLEWSRTLGMGNAALTPSQNNDIAAYIAQSVPDPNPRDVPAPFNAAAPLRASAAIAIPNIYPGTAFGQFAANLQFLSAAKGSASFAGTTATYTARACQTGNDTVSFQATRPGGSSNTRTFTVAIGNPPAPVMASPASASATGGAAFSYQISVATCASLVTNYTLSGNPAWLGINAATGLVSGLPPTSATSSTVTFVVGATLVGGATSTQAVSLSVAPGVVSLPVVNSPANASGQTGAAFAYQITATNGPPFTGFTAAPLPAGLALNAATGLISGIPAVPGTTRVLLTASNAAGASAPFALTLTIAAGPLVITSPSAASAVVGEPFTYQITATNNPTRFHATGLPPGLAVDRVTGLISGSPAVAGTFSATITATNDAGATGSISLVITIFSLEPTVTSPATAAGETGAPFMFQITAANNPTRFAATGLPPGLVLDAATGRISGTPTAGGTFAVTVTVTNATGTAGQMLTITIAFVAPTVRDLALDVPFQRATAIALPVSGLYTRTTLLTLPAHGTLTGFSPADATLTYQPAAGFSGEDRFTWSATGPGGTSPPAVVTITVASFRPVVSAVTMTVDVNGSATLDLRPFITGSGVTGVVVPSPPAHGRAAVNGTAVIYTPRKDFFGTDSFSYVAIGNAGASPPGVVTVTIVGRPDPTQDPAVTALLAAQAQSAARFTQAQIANYRGRLESLHASAPPERSVTPVAAMNAVVAATTTGSADLAASAGGAEASTGSASVWIGGTALFGKRHAGEETAALRFSTDGITVGADWRLNKQFALGLGLGFARDRTDLDDSGSRSRATGASVAGYGSYQPSPNTFVDAVFGHGTLAFDSDRYVPSIEAFATAQRKGRQFFGSIAGGYEWRRQDLLVSPYARFDFTRDELRAMTESGAGLNALTVHEQSLRSARVSAGLRLKSRHETRFGWTEPRARLEYRHELEDAAPATLAWADRYQDLVYAVAPSGFQRNALLVGIGVDFLLRHGLRLGFDYQGERVSAPGTTQSLRFLLSKDLDDKGWPAWGRDWIPFEDPVTVEAGMTFDDNVGRGRLTGERFSDQVYGLGLGTSRTFPISRNAQAVAMARLDVSKYHDVTGLGRSSAGLQGEVQYRGSGDFASPIYTLFARSWLDGYESRLRSGSRLSVGANARRAITDRIDLFGETGVNWRRAHSDVFEGREVAARFNIDYALGAAGTAYLAGEYRRGDAFSSGFESLWNINVAEVLVTDDAFESGEIRAYRARARTVLATIGYNLPLGPRDSIDFSWQRIQATPLSRPEVGGPSNYVVNQVSLVYLTRF